MAKKATPVPEKKKERGHGWRSKSKILVKQVELTEEELAAKREERAAERKKRAGPVRSTKRVMGGSHHLCVRLHMDTMDWLAAEAQIKSTTVSQLVRSWVEAKERESHMDHMAMLGRSGGDA